jgi:hypothetical protein
MEENKSTDKVSVGKPVGERDYFEGLNVDGNNIKIEL